MIPPGWVDLARSARIAATRFRRRSGSVAERARVHGAAVDVRGRLLLDIRSSWSERARGVAAAVHAVSAEICDRCGGPGDPVRLAGPRTRTTRCEACRSVDDEVLPRPPWRRQRDVDREAPDPEADRLYDYRSAPVIEDVLPDGNLSALMEGRDVGDGWPATDGDARCPGEGVGGIYDLQWWTMHGAPGWCPLIRAFFSLVLPMQCEGQARPVRVVRISRGGGRSGRESRLSIAAHNFEAYCWGIAALVSEHSERICCECGRGLQSPPRVPSGPPCWRCAAPAPTIRTITLERELLDVFRKSARSRLGPSATEAEVEALATRLYEGPPPRFHETEEERHVREANTRLARRNYRRYLA